MQVRKLYQVATARLVGDRCGLRRTRCTGWTAGAWPCRRNEEAQMAPGLAGVDTTVERPAVRVAELQAGSRACLSHRSPVLTAPHVEAPERTANGCLHPTRSGQGFDQPRTYSLPRLRGAEEILPDAQFPPQGQHRNHLQLRQQREPCGQVLGQSADRK